MTVMTDATARRAAAKEIARARAYRRRGADAFEVFQPACYGEAYLCAMALNRGDLHLAEEYAAIAALLNERLWRTQRLRPSETDKS